VPGKKTGKKTTLAANTLPTSIKEKACVQAGALTHLPSHSLWHRPFSAQQVLQ